jgi:hypothetical protein
MANFGNFIVAMEGLIEENNEKLRSNIIKILKFWEKLMKQLSLGT